MEAKTEVAPVATQTRVVTVVSTRGEKTKFPFPENSNWSQLESYLKKGGTKVDGSKFSGFDLNNMKAVESINRHTLEHPNATVPNGDFNLFLMAMKSKSGAPSQARKTVKELFAQNPAAAKAHFGNYTHKSNEELESLLTSYGAGTKSSAPAEKKSKAVASVKRTEAVVKETKNASSLDEKLDYLIMLVQQLVGANITEIAQSIPVVLTIPSSNGTGNVADVVETVKEDKEAKAKAEKEAAEKEEARLKKEKEDAEKKEQDRLDREETKRLQDEMNEMMGGFKDVRR